MKRQTLVLQPPNTNFVMPCPVGHEVRLLNVNFQQAVGAGAQTFLSLSQGNVLLCQLATPAAGPGTGLVNFGVKLPSIGAEAENIDPTTGAVTLNAGITQIQAALPDVWFNQEFTVAVPGPATAVVVLYEIRPESFME